MSVKKILNNGNFIAHLAPVLAGRSSDNAEVNEAAKRLTEAASTYRAMLADLGIGVKLRKDWEGCAQAKMLIRWITGMGTDAGPRVPDAVTQMDAWTAEIWQSISDLAEGKNPMATEPEAG